VVVVADSSEDGIIGIARGVDAGHCDRAVIALEVADDGFDGSLWSAGPIYGPGPLWPRWSCIARNEDGRFAKFGSRAQTVVAVIKGSRIAGCGDRRPQVSGKQPAQ
jgi:hypothetical protein